jgi:hypothetical protein
MIQMFVIIKENVQILIFVNVILNGLDYIVQFLNVMEFFQMKLMYVQKKVFVNLMIIVNVQIQDMVMIVQFQYVSINYQMINLYVQVLANEKNLIIANVICIIMDQNVNIKMKLV